jgi:hypothetical protein
MGVTTEIDLRRETSVSGDWKRHADLANLVVTFRLKTVAFIFEVAAFCSEDVREPERSHFAELMNKTKCLEGYVIGRKQTIIAVFLLSSCTQDGAQSYQDLNLKT